jgi:DNA-binding LacI/PurR family transcriptional regulator
MHVTQKEIADRLGVSRQLVTHALNGVGTISEEKRREVLEAAEKMGYRRNELARAVMTGKSRTLGVLINSNISEALGRTLSGAAEEAAEHGYATKLVYLDDDADEAEAQRVLQRCTTWRLEGVLVLGMSDNHLEVLRREMGHSNHPIAFAGNLPPEGTIGAYSDDATGWRLGVKHLVDLGHRRIAHLAARMDSSLSRNRHDLCVQVLREFGLPIGERTSTYSSWGKFEKVEQGVDYLLDTSEPPTALLCSGDGLAMFAVRALRRRGITVPDEMSVVGFGGLDVARFCDPPLTTIAQPHEEVARRAVRQLLAQIDQCGEASASDAPYQAYKLTTGFQLIVRDSTAPPD